MSEQARADDDGPQNVLSRVGIHLAELSEQWFPDAFSFAIIGVIVIFAAAVGIERQSPVDVAHMFGVGFWSKDVILFAMQMVLIVVSGYTVATSPPVYRGIRALASVPRSGRGAIAMVALFSMLSSLFSWSFSLIFSGLLAREIASRDNLRVDYRAMGAAAYLGLGSVWALGMSSTAALMMSKPPDTILLTSGVIPLQYTLFLWQSMLMALVLLGLSVSIAWFSAPPDARLRTAESLGVDVTPLQTEKPAPPSTPGEWLEHSPILTYTLAAIGFMYLGGEVYSDGLRALTSLANYILLMLLLGLVLHRQPKSFTQAVGRSMPATAGIVIQYPLYAGMMEIMTKSGLSASMAAIFVHHSNQHTYPPLVAVYSGVLGLCVPSAGGKWMLEAPYLLTAAKTLQVNMGWVVQTYNAAEALPNLIHPFWMLPLLGILNLRARDLVGYTSLQFVVHTPVVLFMVWVLNQTLPYMPPLR